MKMVNTNLTIKVPHNNIPKYIILHHALAKVCSVYDIDNWHKRKGWAGIGYHYVIAKDGTIYTGRKESQRGAHCKEGGMNTKSIGICLEGCYQDHNDQTDKEVPQAQLEALTWLVRDVQSRYNIPLEDVKKHSDYANKLCPGNYFPWHDFINSLKKDVFSDIKGHWGAKSIIEAKRLGLMNGYPDGTFKPDKAVTRAELATVLVNQAKGQ